jgi:hypothetical protein
MSGVQLSVNRDTQQKADGVAYDDCAGIVWPPVQRLYRGPLVLPHHARIFDSLQDAVQILNTRQRVP